MNLSEYRHLVLSLATGALLLLGLFCLLNETAQIACANPGDLFVKPSGSGTSCSQSNPCALQTALSQATSGDTIYLAGGTYTGSGSNVIAINKSIALYGGWNGAATGPIIRDPAIYPTTLDGENARRVVHISANITPTLHGLRLANGSTSGDGGGIYASGAHPIVNGCRIFNNTANYSGGALYLNNSSNARLTGNLIYGNTANTYYGGGVYIRNGAATLLMDNTIHDNTAKQEGGGVYLDNSDDVVLQGNSIYANMTTNAYGGGVFVGGSDGMRLADNRLFGNRAYQGGGIYLNNSANASLTGNTVHNNISDDSGGGIALYVHSDGATLTSNAVYSNTAGGNGGGLFLYESANVTLANNMITDNRLTGISAGGAGIYVYDVAAHLLHTTIARNSGGSGQGIHLQQGATVWMTNTILVSHTIGIEAGTGTTATLTATLWGDGVWTNEDDTAGSGAVLTGTLNIWGDPAFVNPDAGDYHIGLSSAAIDQGVITSVSDDIDAEPRFGVPDLGADEYWAPGALKRVYLPLVVKDYP